MIFEILLVQNGSSPFYSLLLRGQGGGLGLWATTIEILWVTTQTQLFLTPPHFFPPGRGVA